MNDSTIAERIERLVTEETELRALQARDSEHPNVLEHAPRAPRRDPADLRAGDVG
jgi:hypothetical protein